MFLVQRFFGLVRRSQARHANSRRCRRKAARLKTDRFHPRLEILEDRTVPSTVNWIGGSGAWNDSSHWFDTTTMTNHVPTASDDAVIDVSNITVGHPSGSDLVNSLMSANGTFNLTGGTLSVATSLSGNSIVNLQGGTLANATVANGTTIQGTFSGGKLDGVTLNGTLDMASQSSLVTVTGGLTLNTTLNLGNEDGSTFGLSPGNFLGAHDGQTLTLGRSITVQGRNGRLGAFDATLVNQNTITVNVAPATFFVSGVRNGGTIQAQNGANLTLDSTWSNSNTISISGGMLNLLDSFTNTGTISASNATTNLNATFTLADLGTFNRTGGTVNLRGRLNLGGGTLALDDTTGSWNLFVGTLSGGTLTTAGTARLVATPAGGTLDGMTLNGTLDLAGQSSVVLVTGGLTLNSTLNLGNESGSTGGGLRFNGTQTLGGSGSVVFGGNELNGLNADSGQTLTLGPSITVQGRNGHLGASDATLVNQGTIQADVSGGTLIIDAKNWSNTGTIQAQNGGTVLAQGTTANFSAGTLTGGTWRVFANSTLRLINTGIVTNAAAIVLDGTNSNFFRDASPGMTNALANFATNAGSFTIQNGRHFTTGGDFTNAGTLAIGAGSIFTVNGSLTNFSGNTLTSGTYLVSGTFQFPGANIATNAATIVLDGTTSQIVDSSNNNALASFATNAAAGSFTIQNGRSFTTAGDFTNTGSLTVAAGNTFSVSGSLTNFSTTTLTGGSFTVGGVFQFTNADVRTNAASVVLDGTTSQIVDQGNNNALANFANNAAGGSFTIQNGRNFTTAAAFSNAGTLTVGPGSAFTTNGTYVQTGTAGVQGGGTLILAGGGSNSGSFTVDAGAAVSFAGGTFTLNIGTSLSGEGLFQIAGATVSLTDAVTAPNVEFSGGRLTGRSSLTVTGTLNLSGSTDMTLDGLTLNLAGTTNWVDGNLLLANGATVNNQSGGVFNILADNTLSGGGTFSNAGSLTKTAGAGTRTRIDPGIAFSNNPGGTVTVQSGTLSVGGDYTQTGGDTVLAAGATLATDGTMNLLGGTLSGFGTVSGNVSNSGGQVHPGAAGAVRILTIQGNYSQSGSGVLNIEIGGTSPGTGYDQLVITGTATLGGTLNVSLINNFMTASGDTFHILTFASRGGTTFASTKLDPRFRPITYNPMDVTLVAN